MLPNSLEFLLHSPAHLLMVWIVRREISNSEPSGNLKFINVHTEFPPPHHITPNSTSFSAIRHSLLAHICASVQGEFYVVKFWLVGDSASLSPFKLDACFRYSRPVTQFNDSSAGFSSFILPANWPQCSKKFPQSCPRNWKKGPSPIRVDCGEILRRCVIGHQVILFIGPKWDLNRFS